jgi:tetratricopeptide (TPR) repeat protein
MRARLVLSVLTSALALAASARLNAQCSPSVQKLITDQKYDEARAETQALLKQNASNDEALHCMGRIYEAMAKSGDAVDWFEKAVKANDKVAIHHLWLGNALGNQAQHANKLKLPFLARRVKSEFEKAVELDPKSVDARHGLIEFYSQAPGVMGGSMDKAKEQAREIEKLNPMRGHLDMGSLLENKDKDIAGAEREYVAAAAASPDSTQGYNSLAAFYRRQKQYAEAVATYDKLLAARPTAVNAHLNIGYTLAVSGATLDRGEREIKQWLADPPKDAPAVNSSFAHYVLGMIYEHQAKKDAARAEYQWALTIFPKNDDAKKALAALK